MIPWHTYELFKECTFSDLSNLNTFQINRMLFFKITSIKIIGILKGAHALYNFSIIHKHKQDPNIEFRKNTTF